MPTTPHVDEMRIIGLLLPGRPVVFDVGSGSGDWSEAILNLRADARIHAFEPDATAFQSLVGRFSGAIAAGKVLCSPFAVSGSAGAGDFYRYDGAPGLSGMHRRISVEASGILSTPRRTTVAATTLDAYCAAAGLPHVDLVNLETAGNELEVLRGAAGLLARRALDYILFEYGGTYADAGTSLKEVHALLRGHGYTILRQDAGQFGVLDDFLPACEDFQYRRYLAVAPRHRRRLLNDGADMFDYAELFARHRIEPRGIIHVGANEGQEYDNYRRAGVDRVFFVEADPATFTRLASKFTDNANVRCVQTAVSDSEGVVSFFRMSSDQSNSILKPKTHTDLYPGIVVQEVIEVRTETLEAVANREALRPDDYNILAIDVQGAELATLKGAANILHRFDGIITEVNYEELYEGCSLIWEIDEFLAEHGFRRAEEVCRHHGTWGDAFYVRRPRISMQTLGSNGRLANQIFQYFYLSLLEKKLDAIVETPPWAGEQVFDLPQPRRISAAYPRLTEDMAAEYPDAFLETVRACGNADVWGYFQYKTHTLAAERDHFRKLFRFRPDLLSWAKAAAAPLHAADRTVVAIHLRRGDYGPSIFFVPPNDWYVAELRALLPRLHNPVVYIASDDLDAAIGGFEEFHPVTHRDLVPADATASTLLDFHVLSTADVVMTSNSSFSVAASMLNERSSVFLRPDAAAGRMIPFAPWNTPVLLRDTAGA